MSDAAERVAAFLRQRHPTKTAEAVEAYTGIASATVRKLLERASAPSFPTFVRLVLAYGPAFLCAVLDEPPGWLDAAARAEEMAALEAEHLRIAGELSRLGALR
jgi:hypothetical protein